MREPGRVEQSPPSQGAARVGLMALRVAPWLVFGPITGLMSERAIRCYQQGDRVLAGLYVVANVSILIAIPGLTAWLIGRL